LYEPGAHGELPGGCHAWLDAIPPSLASPRTPAGPDPFLNAGDGFFLFALSDSRNVFKDEVDRRPDRGGR